MGHVEPVKTAVAGLWCEVAEETGLERTDAINVWALETSSHVLLIAESDEILLSPRFAVEVALRRDPTLNHERDAHRRVEIDKVTEHLL